MSTFYLPTWSALRVIGNSYPAKLSIAMPFIGYLIIFQSDFVNFASSWTQSLNLDEQQSGMNYNLFFLYFGLFIFGVGSFIFSMACHYIIKTHIDSDAFCNYALQTSTLNDIREICTYIYAQEANDKAKRTASIVLQSVESGVQSSITNDVKLEVYKAYVIIGLVLLAVPSLIVFSKVCKISFFNLLRYR